LFIVACAVIYNVQKVIRWNMLKPDFKGISVFITGASSGIGEEMAKQFIELRAKKVVIAARRVNELERVKSECNIREIDGKMQEVEIVKLDLADPDACLEWASEYSKNNDIDYVVNNGGIG